MSELIKCKILCAEINTRSDHCDYCSYDDADSFSPVTEWEELTTKEYDNLKKTLYEYNEELRIDGILKEYFIIQQIDIEKTPLDTINDFKNKIEVKRENRRALKKAKEKAKKAKEKKLKEAKEKKALENKKKRLEALKAELGED